VEILCEKWDLFYIEEGINEQQLVQVGDEIDKSELWKEPVAERYADYI
jgi:hypothetical protein